MCRKSGEADARARTKMYGAATRRAAVGREARWRLEDLPFRRNGYGATRPGQLGPNRTFDLESTFPKSSSLRVAAKHLPALQWRGELPISIAVHSRSGDALCSPEPDHAPERFPRR